MIFRYCFLEGQFWDWKYVLSQQLEASASSGTHAVQIAALGNATSAAVPVDSRTSLGNLVYCLPVLTVKIFLSSVWICYLSFFLSLVSHPPAMHLCEDLSCFDKVLVGDFFLQAERDPVLQYFSNSLYMWWLCTNGHNLSLGTTLK